jgi:hypothetical protein
MLQQRTRPDPYGRSSFMLLLQRLFVPAMFLLLPMASHAALPSCLRVPDTSEPEGTYKTGNGFFDHYARFTARKFLSMYYGNNPEDRHHAEYFVLGVVETANARELWCGYGKMKDISILDVLSELKELNESRCSESAAYVITEVLLKFKPCKE